MTNESDRKPYRAPESPRVISTLDSAAASFAGTGPDGGFYASYV